MQSRQNNYEHDGRIMILTLLNAENFGIGGRCSSLHRKRRKSFLRRISELVLEGVGIAQCWWWGWCLGWEKRVCPIQPVCHGFTSSSLYLQVFLAFCSFDSFWAWRFCFNLLCLKEGGAVMNFGWGVCRDREEASESLLECWDLLDVDMGVGYTGADG